MNRSQMNWSQLSAHQICQLSPRKLYTLFVRYFYTLFICSLFYPMLSRYITAFVHFYVGFTLFIVLLYFIISQRFSFHTSTFFL